MKLHSSSLVGRKEGFVRPTFYSLGTTRAFFTADRVRTRTCLVFSAVSGWSKALAAPEKALLFSLLSGSEKLMLAKRGSSRNR